MEVPIVPTPEPRISPGALIPLWELKHKKRPNTPRIPGVNIINPWGESSLPPIGKSSKPEANKGQSGKKRHSGDEQWTLGEKRSSRHGR